MLRILNSIKTIKFPTIDRLNFIHTSAANLKGHAKWQNIKQIKTLKDSQRATLINKNMRIIRLAVQGMKLLLSKTQIYEQKFSDF